VFVNSSFTSKDRRRALEGWLFLGLLGCIRVRVVYSSSICVVSSVSSSPLLSVMREMRLGTCICECEGVRVGAKASASKLWLPNSATSPHSQVLGSGLMDKGIRSCRRRPNVPSYLVARTTWHYSIPNYLGPRWKQ